MAKIEIKENDRLALDPKDFMGNGTIKNRFSQKEKTIEYVDEVANLKLDKIYDLTSFEHPFSKTMDKDIETLEESIKEIGLQNPIIVRKLEEEHYEILAGHRRTRACRNIGLEYIKAVIKEDITDDEAKLIVTDTNLEQREEILPSEKAKGYKIRLEALKRQAGRPSKNNFRQVGENFNSNEEVAKNVGESSRQVQRYIRLNELIPELLDMVDDKEIAFNAAVNLSYLTKSEQERLYSFITKNDIQISLEASESLKEKSKQQELIYELLEEILLQKSKKKVINDESRPIPKMTVKKMAKEAAMEAIKEALKNKELKNSMKDMELDELKEIMLSAIKTYIENKK